ncbi:MAG: transcriptional repressor [Clostridiales bacterium]|nr:transcriptional repressor [Clostridiales bacterium]
MAVLKYSRQRESIKNYLCSREDHPTADMIYTSIREEFPNISLGTVYRNLSLLTELGEIQKITTDGADRFDARAAAHNHFICRRCGRVLDVMVPVESPVDSVNARWDLGEVDECRLEFYGTCNECKKNLSSC